MSDETIERTEPITAKPDLHGAATPCLQDMTSLEAIAWSPKFGSLTIPVDAFQRAFTGGSLLRAALLQTLTVTSTAAPGARCMYPLNHVLPDAPHTLFNTFVFGVPAQDDIHEGCSLLRELRTCSQLTYEELAPLLGVSRRTLHSWNSGSPISARRETHLRKVTEAVKALSGVARSAGRSTRSALLDQTPEGLRPFDLIADGHYQAAVDAVSGRRTQVEAPARPERDSVATQLNRRDDAVSVPAGRLRTDLARRIR